MVYKIMVPEVDMFSYMRFRFSLSHLDFSRVVPVEGDLFLVGCDPHAGEKSSNPESVL